MTNARRRTSVLALLAASALALAACGADVEEPIADDPITEEPVAPTEEETAVPEEGLPQGDGPLGDPQSYIGVQVTATGQVGEVFADTVFELIGDAGQGSILVVGSADAGWGDVNQGDLVRVGGTIQDAFDPAAGDVTDDEREGLTPWEGNAYLEADAVDVQIT